MLEELKVAHRDMSAALDRVVLIFAEPKAPDRSVLADARYKLVRTGSFRLKLLTQVYDFLEARTTGEDRAEVERCHMANVRLSADAATHIGDWDLDRILSEWSAYLPIVGPMNDKLRVQLQLEQDVLYPRLAKYAAGTAYRLSA